MTKMIKDGRVIGTEEQYKKRIAKHSEETLESIIADCKKAIAANPLNPNCDYYRQEIKLSSERLSELEFKRLQAFEASIGA